MLLLVLLAAGFVLPDRSIAAPVPFASGDDAANIPLDASGTWVLQRWVARYTGVIDRLYFYAKVEGSDDCAYGGRSGYAGGTSGRLLATTHRVLPGGAPDMSSTLARSEFTPCGNDNGETVAVDLDLPVTAGQELATVIRNSDPRPAVNYFSANLLYQDSGVTGANGRNERDPAAADANYGLDPRELVGYSRDGGRTWRLPGGPYGGAGDSGRAFIPTYIQQYADGRTAGQPYYWSTAASGDVAMVFPRVPVRWTIDQLGGYTGASSSGVVVLQVDGVERARATVAGRGFVRTPIVPVVVTPGQTVTVRTRAGSGGLALRRMEVDQFWISKLGLGTGYRHFSPEDPPTAVTVYPLPAYWAPARVGGGAPLPSSPPAGGGPFVRTSTLRLAVHGRRATAILRPPIAGRATITLLSDGLLIARCARSTVTRTMRATCEVQRSGGRAFGRVTTRATVRSAGAVVRTSRAAGTRTGGPAGSAQRSPLAIVIASDRGGASTRVNVRRGGRAKLVTRSLSQPAAVCAREPRVPIAVLGCRITGAAAARDLASSGVLRRGGSATALRVRSRVVAADRL